VVFDCSIAVLELWLDAGSVLCIHFVLFFSSLPLPLSFFFFHLYLFNSPLHVFVMPCSDSLLYQDDSTSRSVMGVNVAAERGMSAALPPPTTSTTTTGTTVTTTATSATTLVQGINHVTAVGGGAGVVDSDVWVFVFETKLSSVVCTGTCWARSPSPSLATSPPPMFHPTLALSSTPSPSSCPIRGGTPASAAADFSFSFPTDPATAVRAEPEAVRVHPHPT